MITRAWLNRSAAAAGLSLAATPLAAEIDVERYVESNLLAIFYHELGHALIDIANLPVFGQEEDAADVASVLLIDGFFEEEAAREIAYDTAFAFLADDDMRRDDGEEVAWWGVHGADLQRYYTFVCLFAGADMETRADMAEELDLPQERAETCEEEFDLANDSWGPVFDDLAVGAPGDTLRYKGGADTLTERVISGEVAALNDSFVLPEPVTVSVEHCGEANAFYDPEAREIVMCQEFEAHLRGHLQR